MFYRIVIALALFLAPAAARADWHRAESANFIVYSEGSERDASAFAAKLERFHYVLRTFHRIEAPQLRNKLRVFLLASGGAVARMAGAPGSGIAGYYVSGARGLMLVGTRSRGSRGNGDPRSAGSQAPLDSETILHEYAHHFMYQYFPATYPTWYSEGFAEFWGATRFGDNDVVEVGLPAEHRFATFRDLGWLPLDRLLRAQSYADVQGFNIFLLYAEGWLLTRYAFQHPERQRQLQTYLTLINAHLIPEAARRPSPISTAFIRSVRICGPRPVRRHPPALPPDRGRRIAPAAAPGRNALLEHEIKLSQGISRREIASFASEVRQIAGRHPADPFALAVLMEAERLAGNGPAAVAAAERLLAIEPDHPRALVTRAKVQIAALRAAGTTDQAEWLAMRLPLVTARRAAPNDPIVLAAIYDSFAAQGIRPPDSAQNALYTAMELAPSDGDLRYTLAADFEQRGRPRGDAIIRPEALGQPHRENESEGERRRREEREERNREAGTQRRETAREMLTRLEQRLAATARN